MRPIRSTPTEPGTYYYPVNRYTDETVLAISGLTGLTVTSVSWTLDNIRAESQAVNAVANAVPAASANWIAKTAEADGTYQWTHPIDSIRVILGGATGTSVITIVQDILSSERS